MSQGVECYSCLPKTAWPPTCELIAFFFERKLEYSATDLIIKGFDRPTTLNAYGQARQILQSSPFQAHDLEQQFRALADKLQMKPGQLFASLRLAMTGRTVSPPLFETMEALGKERVQERMNEALGRLNALPA